jgi:hypothetical protein
MPPLVVWLISRALASRITFDSAEQVTARLVQLPWLSFVAVKGIVHAPSIAPAIKPETRDALLVAIAKARRWIEDVRLAANSAAIEKLFVQMAREVTAAA